MSIKSDKWIRRMAEEHGLIEPFEAGQVREDAGNGLISYGTSSYGYDVRCAPDFRVFTNINSAVVDPKKFDSSSFVNVEADVCIIPPNSFALARTVEYFRIPRNILTICLGKSTYARCFRGDTRVALVDGTAPTLEEMARRAESGELFWGYSIGPTGRLIVTMLEAPRYIGRDSLIEIQLDNDETICATPDHQFLLRDGRHLPAAELKAGDSLMPLYRNIKRGYEMVYQPLNGHLYPTHRLADEWNLRHRMYESDETRERHRQAMLRRYADPAERERQSRLSAAAWASDDGSRKRRQQEIARHINLRPEITAEHVRWALDQAGLVRGAARLLDCDRSVFRRFPEIIGKVKGKSNGRNHKVTGIRELPGEHDVYCLTVPEAGNFALEAGVFVHNCGIIVNVTPLEPEWEGHVTLEFSNTTPLPAKIYANEGVAQVIFLESDEECEVSYGDRKGKYQGQTGVTLPKT